MSHDNVKKYQIFIGSFFLHLQAIKLSIMCFEFGLAVVKKGRDRGCENPTQKYGRLRHHHLTFTIYHSGVLVVLVCPQILCVGLIEFNPFITIRVYAASRLYREIFCGRN